MFPKIKQNFVLHCFLIDNSYKKKNTPNFRTVFLPKIFCSSRRFLSATRTLIGHSIGQSQLANNIE